MKKYIYLYIFLIPFLLCCNFAGAIAVITEGSDNHVVIDPGTTYNFTYSSTEAIVTSHFFLDGVESTTANMFKTYTFADEGLYHNVSVYGTNCGGNSNLITWRITVKRDPATGSIEEFSEDDYDNLTDDLSSGDWEGVAETSTHPYTNLMGKLFYLVLFLLPFGLIWMRQYSMNIPVVLAMILGSVLIGFMPEQYKYFIILMIVMSFATNLYLLGRDRN